MLTFITKTNSSALAYMITGAVWFVVGTLYGIIDAIHFVAPEAFSNIGWLVFSRVRPVHINTLLYGFVAQMLVGAALYYIPALLRTRLWSEPLGWASWFFWTLTVLSGPITFANGWTQGREYSEYVWIFDVTLMIAVTCLIVNGVMTIAHRTENQLYVSVWYFMGTLIWTACNYPLGNVMWRPATGAMDGLIDSIFLWFWGHNLPGLLLTPIATGAAYFIIPRVAGTRLNSHTMSLLGFWLLIALYSHIGGHHILQAPIPNWLKTISIVDSVAMFLPVFIVVMNLWLTARTQASRVFGDPAGRLVMMGMIWYLVVCIQGPLQSLPALQKVTHFNNWTVAHAHLAVFGFAGYIALGGMWHVLPLITKRRLWSRHLVNLQFGFITFGIFGFFVVLTIAGLIQGSAWNNGEMVIRVLPEIYPYMVLRLALGFFLVAGAIIGLYNLLMSIWKGEPITEPLPEEIADVVETEEARAAQPGGSAA